MSVELRLNVNVSVIQNDPDLYLRHYDNKYALQALPAILFLAILMLVGFVGNSLVFYVYLVKFKQSSTRCFIVALTTFDLIMCMICIPTEIADIRYNYTFGLYKLCKILRFLGTFSAIASGFTLVAIAVDRFKKICRPFKKQMTPLIAKVTITVCSLMSVVVSLPGAIIYGSRVVATDDININGSDCSTSDDYIRTPYPLLFNGVQFFIFISSTLSLSVLYGLIWRRVARQRRRMKAVNKTKQKLEKDDRQKMVPTQNNTSSSDVQHPPITGETNLSCSERSDSNLPTVTSERITDPCPDAPELITSVSPPSSQPSKCGRNKFPASTSSQRPRGQKTTFMLFLITLVFVLSFLPHLGLMATRAVNKHVFDDLPGAGIAATNILLRSYFINSVSNPIIYSFCNPLFRREVTMLWKRLTRGK
ncbi:bombesin receptor subtype-3-like [Haliotis cracherodii]|uniref:bombesin receptor subtype-3-like n=1 Tax=Haliotis cracherodii TaxID=6455 RepID=UPI0039EC069C